MENIDYAALVERLRDDKHHPWEICKDAADAIERLTQPGGEAEPFRWIRILESGTEIVCRRSISKAEAAHISEMGDELMPVHSATTVARLIAERDAVTQKHELLEAEFLRSREAAGQMVVGRDATIANLCTETGALKEQVKRLTGLLLSSRSSVKADLVQWEQLVMRKEKAGSLNHCDGQEAQRIFDLLESIDDTLTATEPKENP